MNRQGKRRQREMRLWLLGSASAGALLGFAPASAHADALGLPIDHLYLNFESQWSGESGGSTVWADPFGDNQRIKLRNSGIDVFGGLTVQTGDWYLSFQANYGRTGNSHASFNESHFYSKFDTGHRIGDASSHDSHLNLNFMVGQDVGLGMFGLDGTSIVSGGVQYAHFIGRTVSSFQYNSKYSSRQLDRQFWGVGPAISWQASTPLCPQYDLSLEWGANAALLIGRRSFEINSHTVRSTDVGIPQVGGYLGFGWLIPGTPINLTAGYSVMATFDPLESKLVTGDVHVERISFGPYLGTYIQIQ